MTLSLVPEILNTINVITLISKQLTVIDSVVFKLRDIQCVIAPEGIGIYQAVRFYLLPDDGYQGLTASIRYHDCKNFAVAL